ncbi:MAG: trimethylamine methyltransferase family protein, partial [Acidobacteriota bacterium]
MAFESLTRSERKEIHEGALRLLEEVGLLLPASSPLAARLRSAGLRIGDDSRILLPRSAVEAALERAPRVVRLGARDARRTVVLDGRRTFVATDGCGTSTLDLDSGERRRSVLGDVAASARLSDALDGIDVYWMMISAQDVPAGERVAREYLTAIMNTTKHVQMIDMARREEAETLIAMAREMKDTGLFEDAPVSTLISVVSPLRLDPGGTEAALAFAAAGLPVVACSMPLSSVTAPATAPGMVLLAHAEIIGFTTIIQTLHPGAPVIYTSFPTFANAKTGAANYADPRSPWVAGAATQMGRSLNLPCFTNPHVTSLILGTDLVCGGGLLETSTLLSYEQLVIDNETISGMFRAAAPQPLNPDTLALDVIREVGPGGHYLAQRHTARHIREFSLPRFDETAPVTGPGSSPGDEANPRERARREARRILESHR